MLCVTWEEEVFSAGPRAGGSCGPVLPCVTLGPATRRGPTACHPAATRARGSCGLPHPPIVLHYAALVPTYTGIFRGGSSPQSLTPRTHKGSNLHAPSRPTCPCPRGLRRVNKFDGPTVEGTLLCGAPRVSKPAEPLSTGSGAKQGPLFPALGSGGGGRDVGHTTERSPYSVPAAHLGPLSPSWGPPRASGQHHDS